GGGRVGAGGRTAGIPAASATEPAPAAIHGAFRPTASCETRAAAERATTPIAATIALLVPKRWPASCGPSEKKRAPIDHEDNTASAASTKGRRTLTGT